MSKKLMKKVKTEFMKVEKNDFIVIPSNTFYIIGLFFLVSCALIIPLYNKELYI